MPSEPQSRYEHERNIPVTIPLHVLNEDASQAIIDRMQGGKSREEAIITLLNFAGKLTADGVVHIDTTAVFDTHDEVPKAVDKIRQSAEAEGRKVTVVKALTKLAVIGARVINQPPSQPKSSSNGASDLFGKDNPMSDLFDTLFRPR